jgi:hypothetical protein
MRKRIVLSDELVTPLTGKEKARAAARALIFVGPEQNVLTSQEEAPPYSEGEWW